MIRVFWLMAHIAQAAACYSLGHNLIALAFAAWAGWELHGLLIRQIQDDLR